MKYYRGFQRSGHESAGVRGRDGNGNGILRLGAFFLLELLKLKAKSCRTGTGGFGGLNSSTSMADHLLEILNLAIEGSVEGSLMLLLLGSFSHTLGTIHQRKIPLVDLDIGVGVVLLGRLLLLTSVRTGELEKEQKM